jgi:hypothetical protein
MRTLCTCPKCGTSAVVIASGGPGHPRYPRVASARCPRGTCGHDFLLELPLADEEATVFEIRRWLAERRRACVRTALSLVPRTLFGHWFIPVAYLPEGVIMFVIVELPAQGMLHVANLLRWNKGAGVRFPNAYYVALLMAPVVVSLAVAVIAALGHAVSELQTTRAIVRGRWMRARLVAPGDPYR